MRNGKKRRISTLLKVTSVISRGNALPMIMEWTHEEADTRVMVHLLHAVENGSANVEVRTVDTDIVVLLIGHFFNLHENHPNIDL